MINNSAVELVHVVNASGGSGESYTAGNGITISDQNAIGIDQSVVATKAYVTQEMAGVTLPESSSSDSGKVLTVDSEGAPGWVTPSTGTTYTAGDGIDITNDEISVDTSVVATQTDLSSKQDTLTAGSNISISNNTISATDTTYSAGSGLTLSGTEFSVDTSVIATKSEIPAAVTVDQTYNASSTNAQSGTAVAGALATINQVPASTSSDEDKVLTVNAQGTAEWATAQSGSSYTFSNPIEEVSGGVLLNFDDNTLSASGTEYRVAMTLTASHWDGDQGTASTQLGANVVTSLNGSGPYSTLVFSIPGNSFSTNFLGSDKGFFLCLSTSSNFDSDNAVLWKTPLTYTGSYVDQQDVTVTTPRGTGAGGTGWTSRSFSFGGTLYLYILRADLSDPQITSSNCERVSTSSPTTISYPAVVDAPLHVDTNVIQPRLTAGAGIDISSQNVISASKGTEISVTSYSGGYFYLSGSLEGYTHLKIFYHLAASGDEATALSAVQSVDYYFTAPLSILNIRVQLGGMVVNSNSQLYAGNEEFAYVLEPGSNIALQALSSGKHFAYMTGGTYVWYEDSNAVWMIDKIYADNDSPVASV